MNRMVYSPSIELKKEAEELAVLTGLPILYGENEHTKDVDFDRKKVQVIFIPKEKFLGVPDKIRKFFVCPVGYENDWIKLDSNIQCWALNNDDKIKGNLSFMESHYVRYILRFPYAGNWTITLTHGNNIIEEKKVQVEE
jgi:hypothetical protein